MASDNDVTIKFGANIADLQDKMEVVTSTTRGYSQSLVNALNATDAASKTAASGLNKAGEAAEGVSIKTAGATREFIVLGREAMTGNFSRIPGSLIVLANRLGGLQTVLSSVTAGAVGWTAAIGAAAITLYEWASSAEQAAEAQQNIRAAMDATGQSASFNAESIDKLVSQVRVLADVNTETAEKIITGFVRAGYSGDRLAVKVREIGDFAKVTGLTAEKAAPLLEKIFSDPAKGAEELAKNYQRIISSTDAWHVAQDQAANGAQHAGDMLQNIIAPQLDNFRINHLTTLQKAWEAVGTAADVAISSFTSGPLSASTMGLLDTKGGGTSQNSAAQQSLIEEQQHQLDLNRAEQDGIDILNKTRGTHVELVELSSEQLKLANDITAAMDKGDDDLVAKLEAAQDDINAKIDKIREEENRKAVEDAKRAAEQEIEIERDKANTVVEIQKIELQSQKANLDAEVAEGRITKQQELALRQQYAQEEYNIDYNAMIRELQDENLTAVQKQQIWDKLQVLYKQHQADMANIAMQGAQQQQQANKQQMAEYHKFFTSIEQASDQMVNGILQGTQTWKAALSRLFDDLALKFIDDFVVKGTIEYIEGLTKQLIATQTTNAAITASNTAAAGASQAASSTAGVAKMMSDAALTFGGVFAFLAPVMGPAAAGPATASSASVLAQVPQASLATGAWSLPTDMIAQLHQGEMVVPQSFAQGLQSNGGFGGGGSVNMTINALDAKSVVALFNNPSVMRQLAKNIGAYQANNPSIRGTY